MSKSDRQQSKETDGDQPLPNPELRGWYGIGGIAIFGILGIAFLCTFAPKESYWSIFIPATIAWITFLAVVIQSEVVRAQWQAMRDGLRQQRELFELTERPSLGLVEPLQVTKTRSGHYLISATIKNWGKSPAVSVQSNCIAILMAAKKAPEWGCPEPDSDKLQPSFSQSLVAVNGSISVMTDPLHPVAFKLTQQGRYVMFVWIKITYCKTILQEKPFNLEYYFRYVSDFDGFAVCGCNNYAD